MLQLCSLTDLTKKVVRDLIWHPFSQQLITTDFAGDIHKWEFNDIPLTKE